jgi:ribosome-binding protein aMBF1 (putative translation factor)
LLISLGTDGFGYRKKQLPQEAGLEEHQNFLIVRAPMDIRRVVGKNVRRYRIEAELSQEELSAGMGVEQGYVSRLEAGRNPTIVEIWHVAEALGVRPAALFRAGAQSSKATTKRKKIRKPIIQI